MVGTQWYSNRRVVDLPRQWSYAPGQVAILAYITELESELLKSKTADESVGPQGITFYGVAVQPTVNVSELVNYAPLYWLSELDHPMTRLTYLTVEQIQIIEAADLHNSNIGFEHHYGPQNIPSYNGGQGDAAQGDAVDSSNSNTGSPDPSAAMAALDSGFGGWASVRRVI